MVKQVVLWLGLTLTFIGFSPILYYVARIIVLSFQTRQLTKELEKQKRQR